MAAGARALDGHINRALEGKVVSSVSKDGTYMTIHCTNGERWAIGWADFVRGEGFAGEPAIVRIDDMHLVTGDAADGSVHKALAGETVEFAGADGELLEVRCASGRRVGISWVDPRTRERVSAEPCLIKVDATIYVSGVSVFGDARF